MAVINSIRKRSGLLIGTIGVAMVLFVGGDILNGNSNLLNRQDTTVGEMAGEAISYAEFEQMVQKVVGDQSLNQDQLAGARNRAWNRFIQNKILFREYDKLGLTVAPEELFDQIKNNRQNAVLLQYFTNPQTNQVYEQFQDPATGRLSSDRVMYYIKNLMASEQKDSWLPIEEAIRLDALSRKYTDLIKQGISGTSFDAKNKFVEDNQRVSVAWTGMSFNDISDDEITVEESDLKSYYNAHKSEKEFKQEETTRGAKVAIFEVKPSPEDFVTAENDLKQLIPTFSEIANDTLFVLQNSDDPQRSFRYVGRLELPIELDTMVFNAPKDSVFGPYLLQNGYNISKKIGTKWISDSVNARHILLTLKPETDTAAAEAKIDSIKTAIQNGADFEEMAKTFSEDFGSSQKGGNLDWFTQGRMVKEFNDACFDGKKGDMPIVKSQFGFHLIEILDKTVEKEKVLIANVVRYVQPSNATFDEVYNAASAFSINNNTLESFENGITKNELIQTNEYSTIGESDKTLGNLESPRTVIRWIYEAQIGEVSEPFELGNMFVVTAVTSVKDKGVLPLDEVRDLVETKVKNEKKGKIILEKMGNFSDVESAASNLGKQIETANDISFSMFAIPGIGPESKVMGTLFGLQEGASSQAIMGENGVYVVRLDQIGEAGESNDLSFSQDQIKRGYSSRVDYEVFEALKGAANIEDNRSKFY